MGQNKQLQSGFFQGDQEWQALPMHPSMKKELALSHVLPFPNPCSKSRAPSVDFQRAALLVSFTGAPQGVFLVILRLEVESQATRAL